MKQFLTFVLSIWLSLHVAANPLIIISGSPPLTGGGPTFLLNENFEGAGAPAGFGGAGNFDYAVAPIQGAQSWEVNNDTGQGTSNFAANDEVWGKFRFKAPTLSATITLFQSDAPSCYAVIFTDGSMTTDFVNSAAAGSVVADTVYYCWFHYNGGTIWEIWIGTANDRDAATVHLTNGATADTVSSFYHGAASAANPYYIDEYQISTTDFE